MELSPEQIAHLSAETNRAVLRNAALADAVQAAIGDQNVHGYHSFIHIRTVWMTVTVLAIDSDMFTDAGIDLLSAAALLHDAGHHGIPDTYVDDGGRSKNITAAVNYCDRFVDDFPQYDWDVVKRLVAATQWPHQGLGDSVTGFELQLISLLRDADVLSSLNVEATEYLLDGLSHELQHNTVLRGIPLMRGGVEQLRCHMDFFNNYEPQTDVGLKFKESFEGRAYHRWMGYLFQRDGGNLRDYTAVLSEFGYL